jgi:hypothetical protein
LHATGKPVQNHIDEDNGHESLQMFDPEHVAVMPDLDDLEV